MKKNATEYKIEESKIPLWLVEIDWVDSSGVEKKWWDINVLRDKPSPIKIKTIGYLYKKTKDLMCLATHIHFEDGKITQLGDIFYIPRGCIENIRNL